MFGGDGCLELRSVVVFSCGGLEVGELEIFCFQDDARRVFVRLLSPCPGVGGDK